MLQRFVRVNNGTIKVFRGSVRHSSSLNVFAPADNFVGRHIGTREKDRELMLRSIGFNTIDDLIDSTVPKAIRYESLLDLGPGQTETEALFELEKVMKKNKVLKSFIGMGFHETLMPHVIQRNVLENPGWYTAYTPYQAEISQGRLQALLNFQTMCAELTAMDICNASLLDEATAMAEAMSMCYSMKNHKKKKFFVDQNCHKQNIAVVKTRGESVGIEVVVGDVLEIDLKSGYCGIIVQYPDTYGAVHDWRQLVDAAHDHDVLMVASTDLLASSLIVPAGEMGFDIAVGSSQRFGIPMGFGGPHAGFLATWEKNSRKVPGRLVGVSVDRNGDPALRLAMQTREQHIRRDKATSNICTAQALLANMAGFYGVYHGPDGLKVIANRVHGMAVATANTLRTAGYAIEEAPFFDCFVVDVSSKGTNSETIRAACEAMGCNIRVINETHVGISIGEAHTQADVAALIEGFGLKGSDLEISHTKTCCPPALIRTSEFMTHEVFNTYRSETQMLRYLKNLEDHDISLTKSMIALGSCTMKLNATTEMMPLSWPETIHIHPFAPANQTEGYVEMITELNSMFAKLTGFAAVSTQPNSGAQGEYAGLLCIQQYHASRGDNNRKICLIPSSAHGTNPASAAMAGLKVVVVNTTPGGLIDVADLKNKVEVHKESLSCFMVTYPSTYGVFEESIVDIMALIHNAGGLVYMDGANMNAQCMLTSPGFIGADVCHLNLHKTFCIPHGGGGPGVGTIGVAKHLAPFLPGHSVLPTGGEGDNTVIKTSGAVASAPYGSAMILPVSYMYLKMMGSEGLLAATQNAILNANYMAKRCEIEGKFPVLFTGSNGQCAHEFIIDCRPFKKFGITEEDVAKRLVDYGFHAPTMSWPVSGTLMIEPTESEDKAEMDRFCDALISIRKEIDIVLSGELTAEESPLKYAPHTMVDVSNPWDRKYTMQVGIFPAPWTNARNKFWPSVSRVDNVYGDRNLVCSCPPLSDYE